MGKSNKIKFNKKTHEKLLEIAEKYDLGFSELINDAVKVYINEGKFLDKVRKKKLKKNRKDPVGALNKYLSKEFEYGEDYYVPRAAMYTMLYNEGLVESNVMFDKWVKDHENLSYSFPVICGKRIRSVKGIRIKIMESDQSLN